MADEKDIGMSQNPDESAQDQSPQPDAGAETPQDDAAPNQAQSEQPDGGQADEPVGGTEDYKVVNEDDASEGDAEAEMMKMLEDLPEDETKATADDIDVDGPEVSSAEFQQLQQPGGQGEPRNIDLLLDVDLPVSIELGRTKMSIQDILSLGPGSVVELNKLAGEPVDLLINQRVVARGEVVVVDENFGLRITQLMNQEERLKALAYE